jgi:hypothetical protein
MGDDAGSCPDRAMRRPVYPPASGFSARDIPAAAIIVAWTRNEGIDEAWNAIYRSNNEIIGQ